MIESPSHWLVCPNQVEVKRFQKNAKCDDKY